MIDTLAENEQKLSVRMHGFVTNDNFKAWFRHALQLDVIQEIATNSLFGPASLTGPLPQELQNLGIFSAHLLDVVQEIATNSMFGPASLTAGSPQQLQHLEMISLALEQNNPSLKSLSIYNLPTSLILDEAPFERLVKSLSSTVHLNSLHVKILDIGGNSCDDITRLLVQSMQENTSIQSLSLSGCSFGLLISVLHSQHQQRRQRRQHCEEQPLSKKRNMKLELDNVNLLPRTNDLMRQLNFQSWKGSIIALEMNELVLNNCTGVLSKNLLKSNDVLLPSLTTLCLKNSSLSTECIDEWLFDLSKICPNLCVLDVSQNNLESMNFPSYMANTTTTTYLHDLQEFCIGQNPLVESLLLDNTNVRDEIFLFLSRHVNVSTLLGITKGTSSSNNSSCE